MTVSGRDFHRGGNSSATAAVRETRSRTGSTSSSAFSSPMLPPQAIRWWDGDQRHPPSYAEPKQLVLHTALSEQIEKASGLSLEGRRSHEEHVLRILADNEMLRSTITAYSTMETKDTRMTAALETTKQLLHRAEQREEKLVQIYDRMLGTFAIAWWRRSRSRWLYQWAWGAIIGGTALGWRRFRVGAGRTFLHFAFSQWRELHRKEIRQGGKILRALVRRDLQYMSKFLKAWTGESVMRRKLMRFGYLRTFRQIFNAFLSSVIKSRCMRRAAQHVSQKSVYDHGRRVLRAWARVHDREMKESWRRHCTAARDALRNAMQPSAYKEFLLRAVAVHGPSPFDRKSDEDGSMLGSVYNALQLQQQQQRPQTQNASCQTFSLAAALSIAPTETKPDTREVICMTDPWSNRPPSTDRGIQIDVPSTDRGIQIDVPASQTERSAGQRSALSDVWSSDGDSGAKDPTLNARGLERVGRGAHPEPRGWGDVDGLPGGGGAWKRGEDRVGSSASQSPPTARTDTSWPYRHGLRATGGGNGSESEGVSRTCSVVGVEQQPAARSRSPVRSRSPPQRVASGGGEFDRAGPPLVDARHEDRHSVRVMWAAVAGAQEYELRYRFRHEARQTWGGWLSVAAGIQDTSHAVPVREDAVYCFQSRAKVGGGWTAWSAPSDVARAGGRRARRASVDNRGGMGNTGLSRDESEDEDVGRGESGESKGDGRGGEGEGGGSWAAKMARERFRRKEKGGKVAESGNNEASIGKEGRGTVATEAPLPRSDATTAELGGGGWEVEIMDTRREEGRFGLPSPVVRREEETPRKFGRGSPDVSAVEVADATVVGEPQTPPEPKRGERNGRERMMMGAGLVVEDRWPFRVTAISEGKDGERARRLVRVGDELVAVDGMQLGDGRADVMALLQGQRGTVVTCAIRRRGRGEQGLAVETVVLARDS